MEVAIIFAKPARVWGIMQLGGDTSRVVSCPLGEKNMSPFLRKFYDLKTTDIRLVSGLASYLSA